MQGNASRLEGGQELIRIQQKDYENGKLLDRIIDAVNTLAKNVGATAVGKLSPPPPIDSIQVQGLMGTPSSNSFTCPSEILHWTITHNQTLDKGVRYFSEVSTDHNFPPFSTHVVDHGTSRSGFLSLPTFLSDKVTMQTYFLRSYPQYPGSDPQKPTVFGGQASPLKIQMTGISSTTLLSSTGSGTAVTQSGKGLGVVLTRPSPGPKRNLL
jgi:hypothetical protein